MSGLTPDSPAPGIPGADSPGPDSPAPEAPAPPVLTRHLSFGYDTVPAVRDVDLRIEDGEVVVVVGANGSGKSTLVRGLLGLVPMLGGEARLFGVPVGHRAARRRVGYVPQRQSVSGGVSCSVEEVVRTGRLLAPYRGGRRAEQAAVGAALDAVDLLDRRHAGIGRLSGGQQRRALIARALAGEPDLLIMDEPTAGVDPANQVHLVASLGRLIRPGLTLLIVTHEPEPLEHLLTRTLTLADGHVIGDERRPARSTDPALFTDPARTPDPALAAPAPAPAQEPS